MEGRWAGKLGREGEAGRVVGSFTLPKEGRLEGRLAPPPGGGLGNRTFGLLKLPMDGRPPPPPTCPIEGRAPPPIPPLPLPGRCATTGSATRHKLLTSKVVGSNAAENIFTAISFMIRDLLVRSLWRATRNGEFKIRFAITANNPLCAGEGEVIFVHTGESQRHTCICAIGVH